MSENKTCPHCSKEKPTDEFYKLKKGGFSGWCRECNKKDAKAHYYTDLPANRQKNKDWKKNNREAWNKYMLEYRDRNKDSLSRKQSERNKNLRLKVIEVFGGKCSCCGEDRIEFLQVDHIDGGGTGHRKQLGSIYYWLKKHNYPKEGFRLLCANCNWARGMWGYCPHETLKVVSNG